MRTIILEDNLDCVELLILELKRHWPKASIVGQSSTIKNGILLIKSLNPDMVFLDLELTDGHGLNMFNSFENPTFECIILSGYRKFALEAFRYNVLDFLLKPVQSKQLIEAKNKYNLKISRMASQLTMPVNIKLENTANKISIPTADGYIFLKIEHIVYLNAMGNYTSISIESGQKYTSTKTLRYFEEILSYRQFIRINRSTIIPINKIVRISKGRLPEIELNNGQSFVVSARRRKTVVNKIII